jgi:GxxExxY protein
MLQNQVSGTIIDCALKVHTALGPGILESVYETCIAHEPKKAGLKVRTQVPVPVVYDGLKLESGLRLDLLVEDIVIVEVKAIEALAPIHTAQLLSYLKLMNLQLGLLLTFNVVHMRDVWKRVVNNFKASASSASSAV